MRQNIFIEFKALKLSSSCSFITTSKQFFIFFLSKKPSEQIDFNPNSFKIYPNVNVSLAELQNAIFEMDTFYLCTIRVIIFPSNVWQPTVQYIRSGSFIYFHLPSLTLMLRFFFGSIIEHVSLGAGVLSLFYFFFFVPWHDSHIYLSFIYLIGNSKSIFCYKMNF
jgi:hypothetical protein